MTKLKYYTTAFLERLRANIEEHLEWYYSPDGVVPVVASWGDMRESELVAPALSERLVMNGDRPSSTDVDNALIVHDTLSALTSHQASIERIVGIPVPLRLPEVCC